MSLGNVSLPSAAQTRSISAENFDESKGRGGLADGGDRRSSLAGTRPGSKGPVRFNICGRRYIPTNGVGWLSEFSGMAKSIRRSKCH